MSFPSILYNLFIGPLEVLFEIIYIIAFKILKNPGLSIIGLSMVMNLLLLPLYRRTDAIQLEAIETDKKLKPFVAHIKKTFKGNEQFMMLQTCYRQNHYKPTDALKGIAPLMLEIPFFMAAYNYLSGLNLLSGATLGPISDLGAPDGLIAIGGFSINLLPILMTLINIVSSLIYTKDAPLKTKIQLYGMAALFLILLYDSPAGLVFYWTLNNVFSLVKNALMKTKKPMLVLGVPASAASLFCIAYAVMPREDGNSLKVLLVLLVAVILNLPLLMYFVSKHRAGKAGKEIVITKKNRMSFFGAAAVLTVLLGLMIPAALVHTSPEEFIIMGSSKNPNTYVLYTTLIAAGFFLVWMGLFYVLSNAAGKKAMEIGMWILCGVAVVDYMFFGKGYGNLSSQLVFDDPFRNSAGQILLNLGVLAAVSGVIWLIWAKKPDFLRMISAAAVIAMVGMSAMNLIQSQKVIRNKLEQLNATEKEMQSGSKPESLFQLSQNGKNVIVLMLDRGVNGFVPYIMEEKPELREQFAGFTYYPNTLSFGAHTNLGLPSVFGGYEYMPLEMNKRDQQLLESKHNEALKVMPVLFDSNGYQVTVNDPTYAGYDWIPDLSIYSDYPDITTHITKGKYNPPKPDGDFLSSSVMERKFLFYSLFKASPVALHSYLYDDGQYQNIEKSEVVDGQTNDSNVRATGETDDFRNAYSVLKVLTDLTEITDTPENTFMMMCNDTPHSPQLLQMPNYVPQMEVDNSKYDAHNPVRTDGEGNTMTLTKPIQVKHYHCNMATFLQLGKWFDYLRENNVYDNTRIILVADHGYNVRCHDELRFGTAWDEDIMFYNPLLMVKDFGSTEFTVDRQQMTNADVPTLALQGLIENPVNPFTGNPITNTAKNTDTFYISASHEWNVTKNNGTTYVPTPWLAVSGDMMDKDNWHYITEAELPN